MAIPTRFIEEAEFRELLQVEDDDTIPVYKLTAFQFNPPRPVEDGEDAPEPADEKSVRVMLLAVVEPRLYRDDNGVVFVVFPSFETLDYAAARDLHPDHDAWAYRFAPYYWRSDSPLSHASYLFKTEEIGAFDREDVLTH